jgi:hypothetical protein
MPIIDFLLDLIFQSNLPQDNADSESPLNLNLLSRSCCSDEKDVIFRPRAESSTVLSSGSKFGASYTIQARLKEDYKKGKVASTLGAVLVDWKPSPLPMPDDYYPQLGLLVRAATWNVLHSIPTARTFQPMYLWRSLSQSTTAWRT